MPVAIVTGAGSGLGRVIAHGLAGAGLPLGVSVPSMTIIATGMPYAGRG